MKQGNGLDGFPYWIVLGRKFEDDTTAFQFAEIKAVETRKTIQVWRKNDPDSSAFILSEVTKGKQPQIDMGF